MRPRIALLIVASALLIMACLLWIRPRTDTTARGGSGEDVNVSSSQDQRSITPTRLPSRGTTRVYAQGVGSASGISSPISQPDLGSITSPEDREDAINARVLELNELALQPDHDSFNRILAELTNNIPEIRQAALDAVMQSGNVEAIPVLKSIAEHSTDAHEVKALREAMDFLTLPSLTEVTKFANGSRAP